MFITLGPGLLQDKLCHGLEKITRFSYQLLTCICSCDMSTYILMFFVGMDSGYYKVMLLGHISLVVYLDNESN
jgi:hypothetical protein